jgi:hypothetical protein
MAFADPTVKQNVGPANLFGLEWCQKEVRTIAEAASAWQYLGKNKKGLDGRLHRGLGTLTPFGADVRS